MSYQVYSIIVLYCFKDFFRKVYLHNYYLCTVRNSFYTLQGFGESIFFLSICIVLGQYRTTNHFLF